MVPFPHYPEHNLSHHSLSTNLRLCFLSKTFRRAICVSSARFSNTACTLLGICVSHQRHYHDGASLARNPKWETTSNPTGRLLMPLWNSNKQQFNVFLCVCKSFCHSPNIYRQRNRPRSSSAPQHTHAHKSQIISPFLHHSCCLTRIGPLRFLLRMTHWRIRESTVSRHTAK